MARYTRIRTAYLLLVLVIFLGTAANAWAPKTNVSVDLTTTVPSPVSPSVVGQPVTFTATITDGGATGNTIDGVVEFFDGGTWIGVAKVSAATGTATAAFTYARLSQGTHASITATYEGNASFNSSSATAISYTVNKRGTTTAITSLVPTSVGVSAKSTVNVKVTDTANIPAGTRGAFTATGNSPAARTFYGQALLADGKVLLVGGKDGSTFKTSQVYTPGAGTFAAGPALGTARIGATATLLQDGRVLVVGGSTDGTATNASNSAEVYDPVAGTFAALPAASGSQTLATKRMNHAATLLSDGTVLITGGTGTGGTPLSSVELFTPTAASGAFTSLSTAMGHQRTGHTATSLGTTKVLLTGGDAGGDAEIYDAAGGGGNGSTTAVAGTHATLQGGARAFHAATALPDGLILITGGLIGSTVANTVEFYDPTADSFTLVTGTMNVARQGHKTTLLPNGTVFVAAGSATSAGNADLASAALYNPPFDAQGNVTVSSSDGTDTIDSVGTGTTTCQPLVLSGDGMPTCQGGVTPTAVNTNPHNVDASYADTGSVHSTSATSSSSPLNVLANITVKAADDTKTYDGTAAPSLITVKPTLAAGTLIGTDVLCATQTFATRNAGATTTVSSTTGVVFDTACGVAGGPTDHTANYNITYQTGTGNISQMALTITAAVADTKTYDGTAAGAKSPTVSSGSVQTGDTGAFSEAFADRNAGSGKTVTPSGVVNDGNAGANYTYTYVAASDGVINQLATTVTATTNTKTYDSTTSAAAKPTASPLGTGDTILALTEVYSDAKAATGKTLTPSGVITDGNGGANYTYTYVNDTTGVINKLALTVKAATNSKPYDGNTSASATPTITSGALQGSDTAGFTEAYQFRNAGTGLTLIPAGVANDGNSGNNYSYTYVNDTTGTITKQAITVTALTNTKTYDGGVTAAAVPTITSGTLQGTDTAGFVEAYSNKNAGSGKTLTPSGIVNDGNSGANYTYTFVNDTTGVINQEALTVTAATNTKTYDGTTAAAAVPTITTGALQGSDTATFTETYSTRNAGSGLTLTPAGVATDGNGGANYTYVYVNDVTGVINQLATTVTATTNTKTYDATATAAAKPTASPLGTGDTILALTEVYSDAKAATGKTLTPSGLITDGNGGANYTYTYVNDTTGVINKRALTVTAATNSKAYDATLSAAAIPTITSGVLQGTDTPSFTEAYQFRNAGTGLTLIPSGVVSDSNSGNNYSYTFVNDTTGVITKVALTVTAATNTKTYDGTTAAAALPIVTGTLQGSDTPGFLETYGTRNVGVGLTLTPSGIVNDGNAGGNYAYTFVNDTTGVINQLPITVTAVTNTKTYDGTTAAAAIPTITALGTGDTAGFTEAYNTRNAGSGLTLIPTGLVNDGNGGANYAYTYVNDSTGVINQLAITVTAITNSKPYDGTTSAAAIPTHSALGTGDTAAFTEAYSDPTAGTGKTLVPSGLVADGNGGANYTYAYVNDTTGIIGKLTLTVTATGGKTKIYGAVFTGYTSTVTGLINSDAVTVNYASTGAAATAAVGTYDITVPSVTFTTGNAANYAFTPVTAVGGLTVSAAPLTVTANNQLKTVNTTFAFAGTEFTTSGLLNADKVTSATFSSTGASLNATAGPYDILVSAAVGTGLSNYTITYVKGVMTVGAAASVTTLDVLPVTTTGTATATFIFTATVKPAAAGVTPKGTVTFTMDGAQGPFSTTPTAIDGTTGVATVTVAVPNGAHKITATFAPSDLNFLVSNGSVPVTVAQYSTVIPQGSAAIAPATVNYPGAPYPAITLTGGTGGNVSCVVVAADPKATNVPTCSITKGLPATLNGTTPSANLEITIQTTNVTGASLRPIDGGHRFQELYGLTFGLPAFVFFGLAVPASRKKAARGRIVRWLGLLLVVALLMAAVGCGGGFSNPDNKQPLVSNTGSASGSYTAIAQYTDASSVKHALVSVTFTVGQ